MASAGTWSPSFTVCELYSPQSVAVSSVSCQFFECTSAVCTRRLPSPGTCTKSQPENTVASEASPEPEVWNQPGLYSVVPRQFREKNTGLPLITTGRPIWAYGPRVHPICNPAQSGTTREDDTSVVQT